MDGLGVGIEARKRGELEKVKTPEIEVGKKVGREVVDKEDLNNKVVSLNYVSKAHWENGKQSPIFSWSLEYYTSFEKDFPNIGIRWSLVYLLSLENFMDTPDTFLKPPELFEVSSHASGQLLQASKEDFMQRFVRMKLWDSLSLVSGLGCLLEPQEFVGEILAMFSTPRYVLRVPQPSTGFPRIDHTSYSKSSSPALLSSFVQVPQSLRVVLRPREVQSASGLPLESSQALEMLCKVLGKSAHRPEYESGTVLHLCIVALRQDSKDHVPCLHP